MRFIPLLIFFGFNTLAQQNIRIDHRGNDSARKLMDKIDSEMPGGHLPMNAYIPFVDEIIKVDSNYYKAFCYRYFFQVKFENYDSAISTTQKLIRLEPLIPDNYVNMGILYELKKDKKMALRYFKSAEQLFSKVLDTMKARNHEYDWLLFHQGLNLIYVGKQKEGNKIISEVYNHQLDGVLQELGRLYINKSREEVIKISIARASGN